MPGVALPTGLEVSGDGASGSLVARRGAAARGLAGEVDLRARACLRGRLPRLFLAVVVSARDFGLAMVAPLEKTSEPDNKMVRRRTIAPIRGHHLRVWINREPAGCLKVNVKNRR